MPKLRAEGSAVDGTAEPERTETPVEYPHLDIRTGNPEWDATLIEACRRWLANQES
jgi:hypothetical protein